MKKLGLMIAAISIAAAVSAQNLAESKTFDNWYVGVNGGLSTKTTGQSWLHNMNPNAGLRVGRHFTPVFGLALESNAYFSNKPYNSTGTFVRFINTSLLATTNLTNWFAGYKGEPRPFEVSAVYGLGWFHSFNNKVDMDCQNAATSKLGLNLAYNLGASKKWQVYLEPSITYFLNGDNGHEGIQYEKHKSMVQLNAGVVYKFKNSNGTHNFSVVTPRDQAEIDVLNAQINELRNRKPEVVTKEVVKEVVKEVKVSDLVFVTFAQGKFALTKEAKVALDNIKEGAHVEVVGTSSPEGSAAFNQKLSENRANAVADYLRSRGVVVDEVTGKGAQGASSNRLAIVHVK